LEKFQEFDPIEEEKMPSRVKLTVHQGKTILILDASGLKPEEIIALFPEYEKMGLANKVHLYALDVSNTRSNSDIQKASKASIDTIQSKLGKIHIALVGITGIQKIIASAIDRDTHFAENMNEALDWLVKKV
jgi:hypothetical protein